MKFKKALFAASVIAALLVLAIASGCGAGGDAPSASPSLPPPPDGGETPSPSPSVENMPSPEIPVSAFSEYKSVLKGEKDFYSVDAGKSLNIDRLNQCVSPDAEVKAEAASVAVADLDGDGTPEIIIGLSVNGNEYYGYEILRLFDGEAYGYTLSYRSLSELKEDGTFSFSSGAADSGFGTMTFAKDGFTVNSLAYSESGSSGISYYVNLKSVSEDEFSLALERQYAKKSVVWRDFSSASIEALDTPAVAPAQISVDYAPEGLAIDYDEFIEPEAEGSEYLVRALFTTDSVVTEFKLLGIVFGDSTADGAFFTEESVIFEASELTPEKPLVIGLVFPGDMPTRGISYSDCDGTVRRFALQMSGEDGSLLLVDF